MDMVNTVGFDVPLESNPEVMEYFLEQVGVVNVEVIDVFSLDDEYLSSLPSSITSFLLLFPYNDEYKRHAKAVQEEFRDKAESTRSIFFLKQLSHNACGTIALIHCAANSKRISLQPGALQDFISKARGLTPKERGALLLKDSAIIDAHKECSKRGQTNPHDENKELYHFVAILEIDRHLYELDGCKDFPIELGPLTTNSFVSGAAAACRNYIEKNPNSLNFSILAILPLE